MHAASFQSRTVSNERFLPGIHGLRGIAALAVVLFHLTHLTRIPVPPGFSFIAAYFGNGVHLFFVLSAYSLMHSTVNTLARPTWCAEYLIKRFWRIAPLFYAVLAFEVAHRLLAGTAIDTGALLLNLTLSFGAAPWTGLVMAGWTVGVEVLFYVLFPVLLMAIRSRRGFLALLAITILISMAASSTFQEHFEYTRAIYGWNWGYFSFWPNLCFFAMGMYAFDLSRTLNPAGRGLRWGIPLCALVILGLLLFTPLAWYVKGAGRADLVLWGAGFAALALWQGSRPSGWCANAFLEYVGERSYSVYLLHPIVILLLRKPIATLYAFADLHIGPYAFFLCGAIVIACLLAVSEVTYRLIEIPGIRNGSRINKKLRAAGLIPGDRVEAAVH